VHTPPPPTARPPGSLQIKGIKDALIATGAIDMAVDAQNFADTRFHHAAITCQTLGANKIALNSIIISTDFSKYYHSRSSKEKESLNDIVATCQRFEFWDELKWVTDLLNNIKMGMEIVVSMGTPMSAYYPIVVAMEAGHARCLMRKPSAVFDSSTAEAIKDHGAIRFNLDVEASRGSTRKVPMSVPSLHCPIPQLSTTQKQRCVCACAICVHLSRLDMYQVWCYMLDPYMRAFDLTLEQSADLREQLVLWSSPDASIRRQLRAELNQFLTGTGDFGAALSSIKQEILEAAENTMVFYNNRDPNCKPTYKEITFILGLHEDNGHCSGCFPMHARCSVCSTSSIPACYKRDTTQTRHDAQAILRLFSPGGGLISARRSCTNMRPSRC
jgi:hypothetical protein